MGCHEQTYRVDWWTRDVPDHIDFDLPCIYEWRLGTESLNVGKAARPKRRLRELSLTRLCRFIVVKPGPFSLTTALSRKSNMAILILNTAARGIPAFVSATKIRARHVDGVLSIRPTDRKSRVNLPKTQSLVPIAGGKFEIEDLDMAEGAYGLDADKHGWFVLVSGHRGRGPSVKITAQ
jgi:hypothetical protein